MAQVTAYPFPWKHPSPRWPAPSARAMSRATEGFSATTAMVIRGSLVLDARSFAQPRRDVVWPCSRCPICVTLRIVTSTRPLVGTVLLVDADERRRQAARG